MLTHSGKVKLLDFGLAAVGDRDCLWEDWVGSMDYAGPELFQRNPYLGSKVDIFSLGVVLFALSTGVLPFLKAREQQIQEHKINPYIKFPKSPKLSNELQDLIQNMLRFDPCDRIKLSNIRKHPWLKTKLFHNFQKSLQLQTSQIFTNILNRRTL